jgi:hypothetical protein
VDRDRVTGAGQRRCDRASDTLACARDERDAAVPCAYAHALFLEIASVQPISGQAQAALNLLLSVPPNRSHSLRAR